jgi:hypothetical protein
VCSLASPFYGRETSDRGTEAVSARRSAGPYLLSAPWSSNPASVARTCRRPQEGGFVHTSVTKRLFGLGRSRTIGFVIVTAIVCSAASAGAAALITGADVKDDRSPARASRTAR